MNTIERKPLTKQSENEFITRPDDVCLWGFDGQATVGLRWIIDFEWRSWGLKSISAYTLQAEVEIFDEDENLIEQADTHLDDNWAIVDEEIDYSKGVVPTSVEVDYKEKTITVNWN